MAEHSVAAAHDDHDHKPHGWRRWVYATNHKDIGTMYLIFACTMFFIGGGMAMPIPLEAFKPRPPFFCPPFFHPLNTPEPPSNIFRAGMAASARLAKPK